MKCSCKKMHHKRTARNPWINIKCKENKNTCAIFTPLRSRWLSPSTSFSPETGCFLPGPEASRPLGQADAVQEHQVFFISRADLWDFSEALTADFDLCIHPASIQLNPYHQQPRDREHQDGFTGRDTRLLSTCNPLQIIADYWSDTSMVIVIINETSV